MADPSPKRTKKEIPRYCAAANFDEEGNLFSWPTDPVRAAKWTTFSETKVANSFPWKIEKQAL